MLRDLIKTAATAILAVVISHCNDGCGGLPKLAPNAAELETQYNAELSACVVKAATPKDSCECRKGVDEKWGICKWTEEEWPKISRCSVECR